MKGALIVFCMAVLSVSCAGCTAMRRADDILFLKRMGDGQRQKEQYLARQEQGFRLLMRDIRSGSLQPRAAKQQVIATYFEPVFCRPVSGTGGEVCLFRLPTEYFNTTRAYLYFDPEGFLQKYEVVEP